MCYNYKTPSAREVLLSGRDARDIAFEQAVLNGFAFPLAPLIINEAVELCQWGLLPFWAKDTALAKNTLNARIETLKEKPSFRGSINNRCLVLANKFYEWQWLDEKGKVKQKYEIGAKGQIMSFAGLYSDWTDKTTGEVIRTYTIVTTEANELMAEIHNTKKRMPVILTPETENEWMSGADTLLFARPEVDLEAEKV